MADMRRVNLWVSTEIWDELSKIAGKQGRHSVDVVRQLISDWVVQNSEKRPETTKGPGTLEEGGNKS